LLPSGRILYTDESCESVGGKLDRPMRNEISVVPNPAPVRAWMIEEKAQAASRNGGARRTPSGAPIISLCYEPENIRREVTPPEVEAALHAAVSMWNQGCRVSFQLCRRVRRRPPGGPARALGRFRRQDAIRRQGAPRPRDRRRESRFGIGLNREIDGVAFVRSWRRSLMHEFGHVAGVGHSFGCRRPHVFPAAARREPRQPTTLPATRRSKRSTGQRHRARRR